jgi:hypothetical protein
MAAPMDPLYNEIDATTLESVRRNVVFNNFFVTTAFQQKLRAAGCLDPFLGGSAMGEGFVYGRVQGQAVRPGQSVTIARNPINSAMAFQEKAYVAWFPYDDWEMDDGSGQGGVINSGEARVVNLYQLIYENAIEVIETMLEMDSYRHGQSPTAGVSDNRILNSNGVDECFNNGIDPSPYGNIYTYYGGSTRNGVTGKALNSTPLYLGTPTGGTGQIDFNALMQLWGQCVVTGGKPDLGITNVFGFVAIANALDAQRRDVSNTKHDITWDGLHFNGIDIYQSPLAPSSQAQNYIPLAPGAGAQAGGNNTLADGSGLSTQLTPFTSPQFTLNGVNVATSPTGSNIPSNTVIQPGEYLAFMETRDFKLRPTDKPGWNFGVRKTQMPNNVSLDAVMIRLGTNLYNPMPRHGAIAYGFSK